MIIDRIPLSPPPVLPLKGSEDRPLWSVMIPVYNCGNYLPQALRSILMQDPGPELMQIEVIDDCSTDIDVEELVGSIGRGRIRYYRQPENVGSLRNFETCLNRSRGQWVHLLHGDDYLSPGFYEEIADLFLAYPEAGAAFTGYYQVKADGELLYPNPTLSEKPGYVDNWMDIVGQSQPLQPPAVVVKRAVYERLGSFFGMQYGEDWEMWVRISASFPVVHSPRRLANYRVHTTGISSRCFQNGENIKDICRAIDIVQTHLAPEKRRQMKKLARKNFSMYFARTADMVYHGYRSPARAMRQAISALRMSVNAVTLYYVLKIGLKILIRYRFGQIGKPAGTGSSFIRKITF
ncbi:MAG TPA: glycosyltransferase [Puia sp.]|nr:glycosyltransferase [Puia sp.]